MIELTTRSGGGLKEILRLCEEKNKKGGIKDHYNSEIEIATRKSKGDACD